MIGRGITVAALLGAAMPMWLMVPAAVNAQHAAHGQMAVQRIAPAVVEAFKSVPVQQGGRIKPLDTYARFALLKLHGKRRMRISDQQERVVLGPTEWLLSCWLYPDQAVHYPTFNIDDSDVVIAIGAPPHEKKRDRYSFAELFTARQRLFELGRLYSEIEPAKRNSHQSMIVNLAHNVGDFELLLSFLGFARERFELLPEQMPGVVAEPTSLRFTEFLAVLPEIRQKILGETPDVDALDEKTTEVISGYIHKVHKHLGPSDRLHLFPPADASVEDWLTPADLIVGQLDGESTGGQGRVYLASLEALVTDRDDPGRFESTAAAFCAALVQASRDRGEHDRVGMEVSFYRGNYFFWSLFGYLLSFLMIALSWLFPKAASRSGARIDAAGRTLSVVVLLSATILLTTGIVMRCIIRARPPVSTLYETILFITAVGVIVSMVIELMNRKGLAIALAPALGVIGMFLANKYEMKEAVDTMPSLQAVLDTNFWLATHVTCITIGYAAGLLAAAIAHLYILGWALRIGRQNTAAFRTLGGMVYGVLCFGLFFSFIGTMLGGIWANYSWGRFWGWDPKENGALLIVLWQLVVLHARMGGYIRDFGVSVCAIIGGCIVAFSWWGVNLLGVGLHSYGFTQGIWGALILFWGIETAILLAGFLSRLSDRSPAR